jgi:hypothetical protein
MFFIGDCLVLWLVTVLEPVVKVVPKLFEEIHVAVGLFFIISKI